ncbi:chemotaxis protein CheW [Celerinatantimonas yamalensis]|uniref:Chemotaxis protein CheW n=1 Tax=Celerinatantimonas yamalensis TaxID=559956 RepID=A0ABW9G6J9_9GAMM
MSQWIEKALNDYFSSLLIDIPEDGNDTLIIKENESPALSLQSLAKAQAPVPLQFSASKVLPDLSRRAKPIAKLLEQAKIEHKPFAEPDLSDVLPILPQVITPPLEVFSEPDVVETPIASEPELVDAPEEQVDELSSTEIETASEAELQVEPEHDEPQWRNIEVAASFQALFFEVAGITYAVPLSELGGIHQITEINSLFGKPKWFAGMMMQRENKFNAVDMAKWVMPDKAIEVNYRYLVILEDSVWGLCCERLIGTEWLSEEDVKWRQSPGKRPWLAGMIKKRMCALLHVDELLELLNRGVDVDGR